MHSSHSLLLLLLPLLLLATTGPAGALTEEEKHLLVEAHNFYRSQTNPQAANMLRMLWDEELAIFAKAYAEHCVWAHNPHRGRRGENLFAITGDSMDVQMAVAEWHRERDYYNFTTGACQPRQMCGHYTQVVWAKSERVGCDSHLCAKLQNVDDSNVHFLVCNYVPPGNVIGQKLYEVGPPCSACPKGYHCEQSLCEPIRGPEEPQDLPSLVTEAQTSLATEASGSSKTNAPSSLAGEAPTFLVTEDPSSLAAKALPTVKTEAPSTLAMKDTPSMTTEAPPSLTSEASSFLATHSLLPLDERPVTFPKSTHTPLPKSADKVASRTSAPSMSSEKSLHPKMYLTGTQQPLPHAQEKAEEKGPHELPPPDEVLASVFPAQDEPDELQATLVHMGNTSSRSLPNSPNTSANANAIDGHTLALQSSLPGADLPEGPVTESELNPNPAKPNPVGPSPAGPNQAEKPNPLGQNTQGPNPAELNPAGPGPSQAGPKPAGPNWAGPNWAEPNPVGPNLEGPNPAQPGLEESNPVEPEELNPEELESLNPEEPEEPDLEEPDLEEPDLEEPNLEEPNLEEPNVEDPNAEEPPNAEHHTVEDPNAEEPPNAEHQTVEDPNAEEPPNAEHPTVEDPNAEEPPKAEETAKPTRLKPDKPMIYLKPKPSKLNSAPGCVWNPLLGLLLLLPLVWAGIF